MKLGLIITLGIVGVLALVGMSSCGTYVSTYNELVASANACDKGVSNIDESYRRRADLIGNLVESVMSEVGAETKLDIGYAEARAAAGGQIKLTPEMMKDEKAMAAYRANQSTLGNTLGRLMVVAEKIPNPNFSASYKDLRTNLEGVNNRIGISIRDYNDVVEKHNTYIEGFFPSIFFGTKERFKKRDMYKVEEEKKVNPDLKTMKMR
jgi:LemA protein